MNKSSTSDELIEKFSEFKNIELMISEADKERFSRDFFDYSPVLVKRLKGCLAELVVRPLSIEGVISVAKICKQLKVPLTLRGSGTGNYGQSVPINGGVVMIMNAIKKIRNFDLKTGEVTVETGCLLKDLDQFLSSKGRQLRLMPSTWRSASVGGFIAGGSGGIGSVRWGFLRDPGHLKGMEIVTLQDSPQVLNLDADSSEALNHAYGTNGIITSLTLSTCSAIPWQQVVIDCSSWNNAVELLKNCVNSAIDLHLATLIEDEIVNQLPSYCGASNGHHRLFFLVAPDGVSTIESLAKKSRAIFKNIGTEDLKRGTGMRELTWNHTTLHMRSKNPNWTYMQMLLPQPEIKALEAIKAKWGGDCLWHLEAVSQQGAKRLAALPILKWKGENDLKDFIEYAKNLGAVVFNPHVITVEDGGLGIVDGDQVNAKHLYDPSGILNPGKLRGWLLNKARR